MASIYNQLSPLDLARFENYVDKFGIAKKRYYGNDKYLRFWAENKKDLFALLGNQLIYETEYINTLSEQEIKDKLYKDFLSDGGFESFIRKLVIDIEAIADEIMSDLSDLWYFSSIHKLFNNNMNLHHSFELKNPNKEKPLIIDKNAKLMKALYKVISYFDLEDKYKEKFEHFRILHSQILNAKTTKETLCLSIHPMDFVTMSDNANNWSSCMSWKKNGCYRQGTVEMMNSQYVIVAYLKSNSEFVFGKGEEGTWNSKKYRQLFYIDKDFILAGKAYPYESCEVTNDILNIVKELAENNLGWSYSYYTNYSWEVDNFKIEMDVMYNDVLNCCGNDFPMWYSENLDLNERRVFNVSGPAICLSCGEEHMHLIDSDIDYADPFENDYEDVRYFYNNIYMKTGDLICDDCWWKR